MKDKIYTEKEAYALLYHEQKALLDLRGIEYKSNIKEAELVELIMASNPKKPTDKDEFDLKIKKEDLKKLNHILEIASAGFPDINLQNFIALIQEQIK